MSSCLAGGGRLWFAKPGRQSPEPLFWYISHYDWPCGVYAGLREGERDLERECRRQDGKPRP